MPSYKVVYFQGRGLAEPTRMLLACAGQEFEDVRNSSEEWAKIKADTPLQQLPYLEVDGTVILQSRAMHGYVAREYGLNGANNLETAQIDSVIATTDDLRLPLGRILYYEKDEEQKKIMRAEYYKETAPKYLHGLEDMLKKNEGGDGFFVGKKVSRADIVFYTFMEYFNNDEVFKMFPKLYALFERVAKVPNIAAWLAKRPVTEW